MKLKLASSPRPGQGEREETDDRELEKTEREDGERGRERAKDRGDVIQHER